MQPYKHVDIDLLLEVTAESSDLLASLVGMFENQSPKFHNLLQEHLDSNEFALLAKLAHKIKGSLLTLGIVGLAARMKTLEQVANNQNTEDNAQELINEYKRVSVEAIAELNKIRENLKIV